MASDNSQDKQSSPLSQLFGLFTGIPIGNLLSIGLELGPKLFGGHRLEGMYEVLEYESTLELKDTKGKCACFRKREKVRYLQDNIIAYQDQAWGDGEILLGYRCTPGAAVDFHRPAHKTYVLISLREVKNRGDVDEFNIQWEIHNGFRRSQESWETEVSHPTGRVKVRVVFPKSRPPLRATLIEDTRHRTQILNEDAQLKLPDGRWQLTWENDQPRLHERYILKWDW